MCPINWTLETIFCGMLTKGDNLKILFFVYCESDPEGGASGSPMFCTFGHWSLMGSSLRMQWFICCFLQIYSCKKA